MHLEVLLCWLKCSPRAWRPMKFEEYDERLSAALKIQLRHKGYKFMIYAKHLWNLRFVRVMALCGGAALSGASSATDDTARVIEEPPASTAPDTMSTGNRGIDGGAGYSSGNATEDNAGPEIAPGGTGPRSDSSREANPNAVMRESGTGMSGMTFKSADVDGDNSMTQIEFYEFRRQYDNQPGKSSTAWPSFAEMDQDGNGLLSENEAETILK